MAGGLPKWWFIDEWYWWEISADLGVLTSVHKYYLLYDDESSLQDSEGVWKKKRAGICII